MNKRDVLSSIAEKLPRSRHWWDVIALFIVGILFLLVLFSLLPLWYGGQEAASQLPVNLHAKATADYGKDPLGTTVAPVGLGILRALLQDEYPFASDLDQRLETVTNELAMPVPTSTGLLPTSVAGLTELPTTQESSSLLETPSAGLGGFPSSVATNTPTRTPVSAGTSFATSETVSPSTTQTTPVVGEASSTPTETSSENPTVTPTVCVAYPSSGYVAVQDTWIDSSQASSNTMSPKLLVEPQPREKRALIKFDLSNIASGSSILSATLYLDVTSPAIATIDFYEVEDPWTETVTWQNKPGPTQPNPNDYVIVGSFDILSTQPGHCVRAIELDPSLVEYWVSVPSYNYGIMMVAEAGAGKTEYTSRDQANGNAPILVVTYEPPPGP